MSRVHWRTDVIGNGVLPPTDVEAEAALWLERLGSDPDERTRAEFESWIAGDPGRGPACQRVEAAAAAARGMADSPELLALRHETLTRMVVTRQERPWRVALAASVAAVMLATVALAPWRAGDPAGQDERAAAEAVAAIEPSIYRTGVGERLTVTLADGSTVILNTSSRLRVAFADDERRLTLEAGQALFEVAKDKSRPFVVAAGDRLVTALGTAFDVRLGRATVEVKLIEGEVTVAPRAGAADAATTRLRPNEILTAAAGTVSVRRAEDLAQMTSWREGLLVFENEPLAEAVAEINRYTTRPIRLSDAEVGRLRVSGAFRTGETAAFVEALELGFGVRVAYAGADGVVLAAPE